MVRFAVSKGKPPGPKLKKWWCSGTKTQKRQKPRGKLKNCGVYLGTKTKKWAKAPSPALNQNNRRVSNCRGIFSGCHNAPIPVVVAHYG